MNAVWDPDEVISGHGSRVMSIEEAVVEKLRALPPQRQQEVLEFVESLEQRGAVKQPRRNVKGLLVDLTVTITEEDISQARREMWGNFPRDFPLDAADKER